MTEVTGKPIPQHNGEVWKAAAVLGKLLPGNILHPGTMEILGKARELADQVNAKLSLVLIGNGLIENARSYFSYGPDRIFIFDDPVLEHVDPASTAFILTNFIENYPSRVIFFTDNPSERTVLSELNAQISEKNANAQTLINIQDESDLELISHRFTQDPILQRNFPYACPILAPVREGVFSPISPSDKHSGEIIICEVPKNRPQ